MFARFGINFVAKLKKIAITQRQFGSMYTSGIDRDFDSERTGIRIVDLRSDTVTKPSKAMREAMAAAEVGDDVYGDDPTVNALQDKAAELTGKDAALFVPSGTMGNLASVMAHCQGRGDEILVGDLAHIIMWEQGGVAQVAGVHSRQVRTNLDGTLDLLDMENKIRSRGDAHEPTSRLICVEQTHNGTGGRVLPLEYLRKFLGNVGMETWEWKPADHWSQISLPWQFSLVTEVAFDVQLLVKELATKHGLKVHMDGARLFNAATALGVPVAQITQHVDSVTFCLSKGLGAPVGSIIAGESDFISRCWRHRKVLGGGMRQVGVLAAAGMYALDQIAPKLQVDHANAQTLAKGIYDMKDLGLDVDLKSVETNMVYFNVNHPTVSANELVKRMLDVTDSAPPETRVAVRILTAGKDRIRLVLHHQVCEDHVHMTLRKIKYILTSSHG